MTCYVEWDVKLYLVIHFYSQICTILSRYRTAYLNRIFIMSPPKSLLTYLQNGGKFC